MCSHNDNRVVQNTQHYAPWLLHYIIAQTTYFVFELSSARIAELPDWGKNQLSILQTDSVLTGVLGPE
jgi:hypothetical protein